MAGDSRLKVVDASFLLAFLLPDENIPEVEETMKEFIEKELNLVSCFLLPFEIFNCLKTAIKRRRISSKLALRIAKNFLNFDIPLVNINLVDTLVLAQKHDLSFYDGSYVFLARSGGIPLLTLDERLKKLDG